MLILSINTVLQERRVLMSTDKADLSIDFLGLTKAPLLTIDGGSSIIAELREYAVLKSDFALDQVTSYPGVRAALPRQYVITSIKSLLPYIYKIFKIPSHLNPYPKDNNYSLVSKRGDELTPIQTVPHFDTNNPYSISIIHYLNDGDFGGTGFFRHKPTNYEYIDVARRSSYLKSIESYLRNNISAVPAYCDESHPEFEMYQSIDYKPDRMVIFQGYMLHSGLVCGDRDISSSPEYGRLTANMFIEFR